MTNTLPAANKPAPTTAEILTETASRPLHLLPAEELHDQWVSTLSQWPDRQWRVDNPTHGASLSSSTCYWDLDLPDGGNLTDDDHSEQLDWMRRLAWSLMAAPGDGAPALKPGSMGSFSFGLRQLAFWMNANGLVRPAQLDAAAIDQYVRDLEAEVEDTDEDDQLSFATI